MERSVCSRRQLDGLPTSWRRRAREFSLPLAVALRLPSGSGAFLPCPLECRPASTGCLSGPIHCPEMNTRDDPSSSAVVDLESTALGKWQARGRRMPHVKGLATAKILVCLGFASSPIACPFFDASEDTKPLFHLSILPVDARNVVPLHFAGKEAEKTRSWCLAKPLAIRA